MMPKKPKEPKIKGQLHVMWDENAFRTECAVKQGNVVSTNEGLFCKRGKETILTGPQIDGPG